jgi:hypothetical protein
VEMTGRGVLPKHPDHRKMGELLIQKKESLTFLKSLI